MSKIPQILQVDILKHREKLYLLDQLQNTTVLQVINSEINSNLNLL
jgi:predicted transcriptional regulator